MEIESYVPAVSLVKIDRPAVLNNDVGNGNAGKLGGCGKTGR